MAVIRSANAQDFAILLAEEERKAKRLEELEREVKQLREENEHLLSRLQHSEHERFMIGGYVL